MVEALANNPYGLAAAKYMEDEKHVIKEDDIVNMKKHREAEDFIRPDNRELKAKARGRGIIRRGALMQALSGVVPMLIILEKEVVLRGVVQLKDLLELQGSS